jgi:hypothetical protein
VRAWKRLKTFPTLRKKILDYLKQGDNIRLKTSYKEVNMKTIRISEEVWKAIAERGKFGETPDDVLRRVFGIVRESQALPLQKQRYADQRMSARVSEGKLFVRFSGGASREWGLPAQSDRDRIRKITYEAMDFAEKNGATDGQINAVRKALTDRGYHLTK